MRLKTLLAAMFVSLGMMAANTVTTRTNTITSSITVNANVDYTITAATPFGSGGSINIPSSAMEHSVIIITKVKPSVVISDWLGYVKINGAAAVNGTNCQVRMYNKGAIIFPYSSSISPLTCYTENNYGGANCATYTTGSDGGFMKTLTQATLLNNIKSFKLKRGYMVTFATGTGGWGYSRCFIADKEDLEMNLPTVLNGKVSSYRLFEWFNFSKSGLASDGRMEANKALNSTGCYDWGTGSDTNFQDKESKVWYGNYPDTEWIPNHIYEDWPSAAACGSRTLSPHMKTNNEPGNGSDDHPQSVEEVLANWQNLMRTGMRLCSETSHDGSMWHLKDFITAIDARGWRCDIIDLHCYWASGFDSSNLNGYSDYYGNGRPIWISEWIWGASWNGNGAFGGASDATILSETRSILNSLNSNPRVERYFYWNGESKGHVYESSITSLGEMYRDIDGGLGYNKSYEYVPTVVLHNPSALSGNVNGSTINLSWKDVNGDMMDEIRIQYKTQNATSWTTLSTVTRLDKTGSGPQSYTFTGTLSNAANYCWRVVDVYENTEYASEAQMFATQQMDNGKAIPLNLTDYYFQFYSKEASADLVWAVYESDEDRVYYKAAPSNPANDLYQLWALEPNSNGGYSLRNMGDNYLIASPAAWNFITRSVAVESEQTAFEFTYNSSGDYWICKNLSHSGNYVGLWDNDKNFSAGEVLAGNRDSESTADHLGIRMIPRSVINDALGIIDIPSGNYYLYNKESGLFIAAGNTWDTQAIVAETGVDFALSASGSGHTLDSNISNGGNNHYLGSNLYCDSSPFSWTFATAGTIDGKQAYTIANGTNYLSSPTTANTALTTTTNANAASAKWLLLTRSDLMNGLSSATQDNPVNATFLMPCARFGRNDGRIESWNGGPVRGGWANGEWGDQCGEKFNTTFDVYQLIEDAPDGIYEVSMYGYYRDGGYADAANLRQAGNEALNAYLYANDKTQTLPSIFEGAGQCGTTGVNPNNLGYIPDNMDQASTYIHAGLYSVGPLQFTVEGGSLRVGVKKTVAVTNDWTIFDNFKLMYLGPASTPGDITRDGQINSADVIALVNYLLGRGLNPNYNDAALDVNGDNKISLADVTALVNLM